MQKKETYIIGIQIYMGVYICHKKTKKNRKKIVKQWLSKSIVKSINNIWLSF
uniref:Uncharacterized protein n=1 Tax=Anguilla anguilla TaxID=7936 RepID=A0A0E9XTY1_ANGAN